MAQEYRTYVGNCCYLAHSKPKANVRCALYSKKFIFIINKPHTKSKQIIHNAQAVPPSMYQYYRHPHNQDLVMADLVMT